MEVALRFSHLSSRELAIVGCAILDASLAELLERSLPGAPKEVTEFLGLSGDSRAPASSFGARIQLALVTGLLHDVHASRLRAFKALRNALAHQARASLWSADLKPHVHALWESLGPDCVEERFREEVREEDDAHFVVLAALGCALADLAHVAEVRHLSVSDPSLRVVSNPAGG